MRVLLLGATGTLGRAVGAALRPRHEIIESSRRNAARRGDLRDEASLEQLLDSCLPLDAVVVTAGDTHFGPLADTPLATFSAGLNAKLIGQIGLTRLAAARLRDGGSITLTAGILNHRPIVGGTCAATANAGLEGFVRAAAMEMVRGIRINVVSPTLLEESVPSYGAHFPGFAPISAARMALAYIRCVDGALNGQTLRVH